MAARDYNFGEENRDNDFPNHKRGRTQFWTRTELSTDEEEEETRIKYRKVRSKKTAVPAQVPTVRQQAMIDNGRQLHANEGEAQRAKDEERLNTYICNKGEEDEEFDHARLSDDFNESAGKMYLLKKKINEEAANLVGSKKPVRSGNTYKQLHNVALSKFNEMDRREQLLMRSESPQPKLREDEWKDLRWEMNWIIGVRNSYDNWDWTKDETKR